MVAAGGAGLNINPRGRPGRAPALVRLRLNSRNHAAIARAVVIREPTGCRDANRFAGYHRGRRWLTEPRCIGRIEPRRWIAPDGRTTSTDASFQRTCIARRITSSYFTGLHRFFDALANATITNDPAVGLEVRDCRWPRAGASATPRCVASGVPSESKASERRGRKRKRKKRKKRGKS